MSFLTNLAKDFGKSVINQAQRMNEWMETGSWYAKWWRTSPQAK